VQTALNLHRYLGEVDPLARRFLQILIAFEDAIARDTVSRVAPTAGKAAGKDVFSAFFGGVPSGAAAGLGVDARPMTSSNGMQGVGGMQPSSDWQSYQTAQQRMVGGGPEMMQMPPGVEMGVTGISPPDYSLDFDAFLTSVSQDQYAQDTWMPLYGTMDVN
jgi:hypothetical protein